MKQWEYFYVYLHHMYEYMKSLRNYVNNLFDNTHVGIKIYWEFYHGIIYLAHEGRHFWILENAISNQAINAYDHQPWCSISYFGEGYSIWVHLITCVSDLRQANELRWVPMFSNPTQMTATI